MTIDRFSGNGFFVRNRIGRTLAIGYSGQNSFLLAQHQKYERDLVLCAALESTTGIPLRKHEYIPTKGKARLKARLYPLDRLLTNTEAGEWLQAHKITAHDSITQVERNGRFYMRVPELRWSGMPYQLREVA